LQIASGATEKQVHYEERQKFYEKARNSFLIIHTDDKAVYANCIVSRGVTGAPQNQQPSGFFKGPLVPPKLPFGK